MSASHLTGTGKRLVLDAASAKVTVVTNQIGSGGAIGGLWLYDSLVVLLNVTAAATEAGDTLDVYIDTSIDGGATWINVVHFPQVLGNGGAKKFAAVLAPQGGQSATAIDVTIDAAANAVRAGILGDMVRARYTTVDVATLANMSFTFSVTAELAS